MVRDVFGLHTVSDISLPLLQVRGRRERPIVTAPPPRPPPLTDKRTGGRKRRSEGKKKKISLETRFFVPSSNSLEGHHSSRPTHSRRFRYTFVLPLFFFYYIYCFLRFKRKRKSRDVRNSTRAPRTRASVRQWALLTYRRLFGRVHARVTVDVKRVGRDR